MPQDDLLEFLHDRYEIEFQDVLGMAFDILQAFFLFGLFSILCSYELYAILWEEFFGASTLPSF